MQFIRAYMTHGHLKADLDPLGLAEINNFYHKGLEHRKLTDYREYGFTDEDLDRTFYVDVPQLGGILARQKIWTLRELNTQLDKTYCGKMGVEYMHIPNSDQCVFIRNEVELRHYTEMDKPERMKLLDRLLWADEFAKFIGTKFNTMKRFGLEGLESFIPGMKVMIQ